MTLLKRSQTENTKKNMKVKQLIEILEKVDPELPIYVWSSFNDEYREADSCDVDELILHDDGEPVYNEETDEYEMFTAFTIGE